jgi:hypothetical protein
MGAHHAGSVACLGSYRPNTFSGISIMTEATAVKKAATVYNTVKMDDGRVVDFPGKRRLQKETWADENGLHVRLDFVNGETRTFTIPESLIDICALHGAGQKLGDEISNVDDIDDAITAVDELMDRLNAGDWAMKREAGAAKGGSILAKALAELSGKSLADAKSFLSKKSQAEKLALRRTPSLLPIVQRLEAEKATKGKPGEQIDASGLLDEFTS